MNRLALGAAQFGMPYGIGNKIGKVALPEMKEIMKLASDSQIDVLDTAISYGDSEACLGKVGIQGFKVITKLPAIPEGCRDVGVWVRQQVNASLLRLGVRQVYGLLLHRPDQLLGSKSADLYQALQLIKSDELVQKIGLSIYAPSELDFLIPAYHFDIVQAPFNLIDRRLHTSGWLKRLKDSGIEVHTRSAFLQGLLLMKSEDIPNKFSPWTSLWHVWHDWLATFNISPVDGALTFPLSFAEIDRVIVGADSRDQLMQIISASKRPTDAPMPNLQCDNLSLINPGNWSLL